MSAIEVAVDAHAITRDQRGIGRYARAVVSRAVQDPRFGFTFVERTWLPRRAPISRALGGAHVRVTHAVPRTAAVMWSPSNGTYLRSAAPSVATIHDCTPFAFPAASPRTRTIEQTPFLRSAQRARRILVQSEFTASEVVRWLGVERDRIVVTPLGVEPIFRTGAPLALPAQLRGQRYILVVGEHDARKNTPTIARAFEQSFPTGGVTLAFTRRPPSLPAHAVVVEAPSDDELLALYRGAALVAVPSISEGFGLQLLEALSCGAPALAACAGALPEVGGDAAAWIADPLDVEAWAAALRRILGDDDERAALSARGPLRAAMFSWERCTAQTLEVLREVAAAG